MIQDENMKTFKEKQSKETYRNLYFSKGKQDYDYNAQDTCCLIESGKVVEIDRERERINTYLSTLVSRKRYLLLSLLRNSMP